MSVYYRLNNRILSLEQLVEDEKRKQRLSRLPPITQGLQRATSRLNTLLSKRRLWIRVYQQEVFPKDEDLNDTLRRPLKHISRSSQVFQIEEDELQNFQETIRTTIEQIDEWTRELEHRIETFQQKRSEELEVTKALLRIPNLMANDIERRNAQTLLNNIPDLLTREGTKPENAETLANRWETEWHAFEELQTIWSFDALRRRFDFSHETMSVLRQFVNGESLQLSAISIVALEEIQQIRPLANQISLHLKAN